MNRLVVSSLIVFAAVLSLAGNAVRADDTHAQPGCEVLNKHSAAVVTVTATQKIKMVIEGEGGEMSHEKVVNTYGTIIDPSGLTVMANSNLDSSGELKDSLNGCKGEDGKPCKTDVRSELSDIKLRMSDGTEVPAKLVMQDEDLGLAFIRPDNGSDAGKKLAGHYPCVKMEKISAPHPLDTIYSLTRMGQSLDWQVGVQSHEVSLVVNKQQTRYVVPGLPVGSPAFNADGQPIGIAIAQKSSSEGPEQMGPMMMLNIKNTPAPASLVVPAGEVIESAKQASNTPATAKPATAEPAAK
jgi:hypothetical protein